NRPRFSVRDDRAGQGDRRTVAKGSRFSVIVIGNATAQTAARQADWIATMEPWRSLGFSREGLTRFLRQSARRAGGVLLASAGKRGPALGIVCVQEGVLLGNF